MRTTLLWTLTALVAVNGQTISTSGSCGAASEGLTCAGSVFGNCCSQYGWCGSTSAYCGTGCQSGYGTCTPVVSSTGVKVSDDGSCGGTGGMTCQGSTFGNCCSFYGWCGSTSGYCKADNCNPAFGTCNSASSSSSSSTRKATTLTTITRSSVSSSSTEASSASSSSSSKVSSSSASSTKISSSASSTKVSSASSTKASSSASSTKASSSSVSSTKVSSSASSTKVSSSVSSTKVSSSASSTKVSSSASSTKVSSSASSTKVSSSASSTKVSSLASSTKVSSSVSSTKTYSSASSTKISSSASSTKVSSSSISSTKVSSSASSTKVSSSASSTMVSSSSASPTQVSSSIASSTQASSTLASSTTASSSSALPTPTPQTCFTAPSNYISNGGFENGFDSWSSQNSYAQQYYKNTEPHTGTYAAGALYIGPGGSGGINLSQHGTTVATGTQILVNVYVKQVSAANTCTFTVKYNGATLATETLEQGDVGSYLQVGTGSTPHTVTGSGAGLVIQASCRNVVFNKNMFFIDDVTVTAVKGPNGQAVCSS
ncbi:hypothetical protein EK21DRAFT_90197 [Setomelanomma holmii]|uniref:Chitin-binding type-1 domain-containing protein n=1 Tax=Setomelanomma holmii TaxID=210430 RepID=A0A9P4LL91_9PLEO|nr:hypothetical protein EK21DRAFT_90197 [Setomelanomma holmii]